MNGNKFSVKEKKEFGGGGAPRPHHLLPLLVFFLLFLNGIFGLAPALVGVLLLSVRVIDAVTDPIMGLWPTVPAVNTGAFVHGCCGLLSRMRYSAC